MGPSMSPYVALAGTRPHTLKYPQVTGPA